MTIDAPPTPDRWLTTALAHHDGTNDDGLRPALAQLGQHSVGELVGQLHARAFTPTDSDDATSWRRDVIGDARARLGQDRVLPPRMASIVLRSLEELDRYQELAPYLPPTDFPSAAHRWLCGRDLQRSVGVAILLYYVGLHLLDDVHDGELAPDMDANLVTTTATLCICALPMVVLEEDRGTNLPGDGRLAARLACEFQVQTRDCTAGQFLDLDRDSAPSLANARLVLALRNGSLGRLLGRLAAIAAGCDDVAITTVGESMADIYIASQIMDDIENLWSRPVSSDALNLSKTLLLCYGLELGRERAAEIRRLAGEGTMASHRRLRGVLADLGAFHYALAEAVVHFRRAQAGLQALAQRGTSLGPITELIARMCPLRSARLG